MGGLYLGPGVDSLDSDYTPRICLEEKSIMPPLYEALRGSPVGTAPEGNGSLHCPPPPPPLPLYTCSPLGGLRRGWGALWLRVSRRRAGLSEGPSSKLGYSNGYLPEVVWQILTPSRFTHRIFHWLCPRDIWGDKSVFRNGRSQRFRKGRSREGLPEPMCRPWVRSECIHMGQRHWFSDVIPCCCLVGRFSTRRPMRVINGLSTFLLFPQQWFFFQT